RFRDRLETLQRSIAHDPRIELRDGFLSREEMSGLQNAADCFVSLHRAEGFGLGLAECMYFGKPVIATGYSGNMDFMDHDNSLLVDYRMIPLRNGDYPYWQGQRWADPDIAHAARLMRQIHEDRNLARQIGDNAAASIRRSNSGTTCGTVVTRRLQDIARLQRAT
ncbi:MAG: glycosyltransferase, partial [Rhodanobacteraceae bacterium]